MVVQNWTWFFVALGVVAVTTLILKVNWYDKMEDYPADITAEDYRPAYVEEHHA
jgi:hypothetical protein